MFTRGLQALARMGKTGRLGWRVVRISVEVVISNLASAVEQVREAVQATRVG